MNIKSIVSFACLATLVACSPKDPKNPNFVVASYKGGKITRAELTSKESELLATRGGKLEDIPAAYVAQFDWEMTNRLVIEKVLDSKVAQLKAKIQPAIDAEYAEAKLQISEGNEENFQKRLAESGLTEETLRENIAKQEAIRYLISQEKDAPAPVTAADVKAYYDEHMQSWQQEEVYSLRYIAVPLPANAGAADKKQAQTKAEAARKRVSSGEDFVKVAKEHAADNPQAGSTQPVPASRLSPELNKIVKPLKAGAVSAVQQIGDNYLVFQVVEITPAKVIPFDEVKNFIHKRLQGERENPFARTVLEKLRDDAKIQFNIPDPAKEAAKSAPAAPEAAEKK